MVLSIKNGFFDVDLTIAHLFPTLGTLKLPYESLCVACPVENLELQLRRQKPKKKFAFVFNAGKDPVSKVGKLKPRKIASQSRSTLNGGGGGMRKCRGCIKFRGSLSTPFSPQKRNRGIQLKKQITCYSTSKKTKRVVLLR